MSILGDFFSFGLNSGAAKKENRLKQELLNQGAKLSAEQFDKRMAALGLSDSRITGLATKQHDETGQNADSTFSYLLDQAQKGFNEQQQIGDQGFQARYDNTNDAFGKEMGAQSALMTAQRQAREANERASDAERDRQLGFQSQVDALSAALPGQIGYGAQTAGRSQALGDRTKLINATATKVAAPVFAGSDPTLSGAYAAAADRGSTAGLGDALRSADLSSYGDAFEGAQRQLGGYANDVAGLTTKADLSRSALPAELGVGKLQASDAKDRYDFASGLAKDMGDGRDRILADNTTQQGDIASGYRSNLKDAKTSFSDQFNQMLQDYYGNRLGSEGSFISGLTDSSQNLENKLLNLNNFKMGNTSVTSPLASFVKMADAAGEQVAKAYAGGGK